MGNVVIEEKGNQYIISIDKDAVDAGTLRNFVDQLRFEQLSRKADYNEMELQAIGEEIKDDWWRKNKWWITKGMEDYKKQNGITE